MLEIIEFGYDIVVIGGGGTLVILLESREETLPNEKTQNCIIVMLLPCAQLAMAVLPKF